MNIESLFSVFGINSELVDINNELCEVKNSNFESKMLICHKTLTFGGRENIPDELRVQIMFANNNTAFNEYQLTGNAALLGIHDSEDIVCAWKLKHSDATQGTISKQIKTRYIEEAKKLGFVQALPNRSGERVCVFRKEFIYFYLNNSSWLHNELVENLNDHLVFENVDNDDDNNVISESDIIKGGQNIILYGVPGAGKSYTLENDYKDSETEMKRVVFHPDYTYSDFVGQILPLSKDGDVRYDFIPGPFTTIVKQAYENPTKKYVLAIEEINRGNAPAIFGDIFQLLDRDQDGNSRYTIANKDVAKIVFNNENKEIYIPSNLYLICTMNTSDQNVFTLDTAFQRRWHMRLIENEFKEYTEEEQRFANHQILDTEVSWKKFCKTINDQILDKNQNMTSSEDKRLGTHFVLEDDLTFDENEKSETATPYEKKAATLKNRRFPEKIIKYLWDDAFKFYRDEIFNPNYNSLEKIIAAFTTSVGNDRFNIFKDAIKAAIVEKQN